MPSPFPGMDPWLEDQEVFPDLHDRLLINISQSLNKHMPQGYAAITKHRVWVDTELRRDPDVSVFGQERNGHDGYSGSSVALATLERAGLQSAVAVADSDPIEEIYLEIRSDRGKRLVTAVEILSRSNKKPGDNGRTSYLQKQGEYRLSGVNSVEIDLLRSGQHTTAFPEDRVRASGAAYHACITVPFGRTRTFFVPIPLAHSLPSIPIPLDLDREPVNIDLQAVFTSALEGTRFPEFIRSEETPDPPLTPDQHVWADSLLRQAGLRA
jgi:hypothetical protein